MEYTCKNLIRFTMIVGLALSASISACAQSDSLSSPKYPSAKVYNMNYWVTGCIDGVAAVGGILSIPWRAKPNFDSVDLANINPNNVPSYDRSSLHQNPLLVPQFETYSEILQFGMAALPLTLLFDSSIRQDGLEIMTMALEVNAAAIIIYTISPLGPLFITRYRPIVYYPKSLYPNNPVDLYNGNNKNSFYSGHVASVAAASFFMAKVYCDYHPDASKYLIYSAAAIPPLVTSYVRFMALDHFPSDIAAGFGIGVLCGVLIPELHRIGDKNLSMGVYSSPTTGTGLAFQWRLPEKSLN